MDFIKNEPNTNIYKYKCKYKYMYISIKIYLFEREQGRGGTEGEAEGNFRRLCIQRTACQWAWSQNPEVMSWAET